MPASDFSRMTMSSGTSPRNGTPRRSASWRAPPWPKMSELLPQCGQMKVDMFSTMEYRHVDALEHGDAAPRVDQSEILRRRDDDGAFERHLLRHGELRVAGAGWHVDHHDVERAPLGLAQHLRQGRHNHRPAPDHRRLFVDQKAD